MTDQDPRICPHCNQKTKKWLPVEELNWGLDPQYICFNDECPYYIRGWEHTRKSMKKPASYRYRYIPATGAVQPIPVWSETALKDRIVPEDE